MKIIKQDSIVVTFSTTTAALNFEMKAQAAGVKGRIIPVPRDISAGCGLAFMVRKGEVEKLDIFMEETNLEFGERYELKL